MADPLYVGLMSGTSMDAIDCALVSCGEQGTRLLASHEHPIDSTLRERIAGISHCGDNEIERLGRLDRDLGLLFAAATHALLADTNTNPAHIRAIGSHGQTIRHRPPSGVSADERSFTLQIGDPNTIAEITGITTVADFRRRDIAAGGEGAPLAPAFHAAAFASEQANRAIVNIGGIANISLLQGQTLHSGFDTGPGNTLLDHWIERHRGEAYDRNGDWAATGQVLPDLLQQMRLHPYFNRSGPRSTGKEAFNLDWLDGCLSVAGSCEARDVQATLAELTADSITTAIKSSTVAVSETYICGGGAHNVDLMSRLRHKLAPITLGDTGELGLDPDWVEAAAFAWLAGRTLDGLAGNAPEVTGAAGSRVLGAVFAGGN